MAAALESPSLGKVILWIWGLGIVGFLGFELFAPNYNMIICARPIDQRILSDLRSLRTAVESYAVDWGQFPGAVPITETGIVATMKAAGISGTATRIPDCLTSPIAYVASNSTDPRVRPPRVPFIYASSGDSYLLYSAGPDGIYQLRNPGKAFAKTDPERLGDVFAPNTYDPSNGVESAGDLWVCRERSEP